MKNKSRNIEKFTERLEMEKNHKSEQTKSKNEANRKKN